MSYNFCHVQSQNAKTLTQGQKTTFHNTLFEMNFSRDRELLPKRPETDRHEHAL